MQRWLPRGDDVMRYDDDALQNALRTKVSRAVDMLLNEEKAAPDAC